MQAQAWRAATRTWGFPRLPLGPGMPRHARVAPGFIAARWPPEALRQAQSIVAVVAAAVRFADKTEIRRQTTESAVAATFLSRRRGQRRLQSPNGDWRPAWLRVLPEHALFPQSPFPHVEDRQVPRLRAAAIHVPGRLLPALPNDALPAEPLSQHLAFDDVPARIGSQQLPGQRPIDEQVCPSARDCILPRDASPLLITRCG